MQRTSGGPVCPLADDPPLPFPDGAFELIYGVSVFTHFRSDLQDLWLQELRRVTQPGGILLMTTHGQTAIDFAGLDPAQFASLRDIVNEAGIFEVSKNDQLDGAVEAAEEYVNVFHSGRYIKSHWSRWFEIVAIVPGYIFTHDLVVMRRR
ncbi:MAG: class I SAM-dependent methyltransferase [Betaproteobacteria bacterium]|nr:class I SAM-dependent methyltransferase [Betaproteobacteria bacterium]